MLAAVAALVLAAAPSRVEPGCPTQAAHVIDAAQPVLPPDPHPTTGAVRMFFDIGSDGRVRRAAVADSSGDPAVDAAALDALRRTRFAPPSYRCVAVSTGAETSVLVPPAPQLLPEEAAPAASGSPLPGATPSALLSPAPVAAAAAPLAASPSPSAPASAAKMCLTPPFVRVTRFAGAPSREPAGTADVDVRLDARAHVTGVRVARSSGNERTDYAAAVMARRSAYAYLTQTGCPAGPATYRLELTFR
ncbi:MAG TPA: TonB family protein [Candidatus Baltobacteraceae bacterium]|nr:TonB family protein [Candidatus Baltobacteraceae bacterium]